MKRSLTLKRDALSDLTDSDLGGVVGGNYTSPNGISCGLADCADFDVNGEILDQVLTIPSRLLTCYTCI